MDIFPKVSIVIPVYNGANYMREAINSALAQTYSNVEVIVINDGSNDKGETERIAQSYGTRIRYFHKPNGGVSTALNLGIEKMTGDYFSWLSHDDVYAPDKIEKQIQVLLNVDEPAIAYSDFCTITSSGKIIEECRVSPKGEISMRCLLAIRAEIGLHGCALLIPRILFDQYGGFDPRLKYSQDLDAWFRFASEVPFIHVKDFLVFSRQHEEQDSKTKPVVGEVDYLHFKIIGQLDTEEVTQYCEGSVEYLINAYYLYKNAGYLRTSYQIFKHLVRVSIKLGEEEKLIKVINEELYMGDIGRARLFWKKEMLPLLKEKSIKTRVMVYSNVWVRGGIERVFSTILNELHDKYSWVLVSCENEKKQGFSLNKNISHLKLFDGSEDIIASRLTLLSVVLEIKLFIGNPNIIKGFLDIYEALEGIDVKSIACNHGYYFLPYHYQWLYPVIDKRVEAYKHADAVTWLTSFATGIYSSYAENSVLMPNPNTFENGILPSKHNRKKVILSVGRFYDPIKRIDRILNVFSRILKIHPDAELVLVGGYDLDMHIPAGSPESIRELLVKLSIPQKNITFVGETDDVRAYYENASVLLMTSESEGFPMVLNEAGIHGLPCVISEVPGLEDIITEGENGFIVRQDDLEAMAAKVSTLLNDEEVRKTMGCAAQQMVQRFDKKLIMERWQQLIDLVLSIDDRATLNNELKVHLSAPTSDARGFTKRMVREYEKNIALLIDQIKKSPIPVQIVPVNDLATSGPCIQCIELQNSRSWRITKPLRLSKLVLISLKNEGLRITAGKVARKLKNKFS